MVAAAGADAIGLVHWAPSSRAVELARARAIRAALPPFVSAVALFVDPAAEEVYRVLDATRPDLLQFHGEEDEGFCLRFGVPYIKAMKVTEAAPAQALRDYHAGACGILLDSHDPVTVGGTGRTFDWTRAPGADMRPLLVAGGLRPDNVGQAIRLLRPYAVDVSSGVESAPGVKCAHKVRAFMDAVNAAMTD
jgi:phosphoribosylanthranilate isomerase